jgi:hypothetical protein
MSKDFSAWRVNKFVIVESEIVDGAIVVALTDLSYWHTNADDLLDWCQRNNCTVNGLTVTIPSENQLAHFVMRWM